MSIFGGDAVARRTPVVGTTGTTTAKVKKHITPKWVDRVLLAILISIPVLYALGFSVNKGPSMGNLGLVYKTSWGEQPTRVGQIIRFAQPDQPTWRKFLLPSIKRVAEIRNDGYFVEGDNSEHSQDSRDWGKVVPPDHIAGVITWCWSPKRAWQTRTAEGRFENWKCFSFNREALVDGPNGMFVAKEHESFTLWRGKTMLTHAQGLKPTWVGDDVGFYRDESYLRLDTATLKVEEVRDGTSVIKYRRNPGSAEVWRGKVWWLVGQDAWATEGKLFTISPELYSPTLVKVVVDGKSYDLLGCEFHPEWDYTGFKGGATLFIVKGLPGKPRQELDLVLVRVRKL